MRAAGVTVGAYARDAVNLEDNMSDAPVTDDRVVERYLSCLAAHDWDGLAATIADEGVVREGPFCDVVEGKHPYLAFLRDAITPLEDHEITVQRISHVSNRRCYVELRESFRQDASAVTYPECIALEQNGDGLITGVSVYLKQPAGAGPRG
jgi:limonene-1,2-epoxide hydrolase